MGEGREPDLNSQKPHPWTVVGFDLNLSTLAPPSLKYSPLGLGSVIRAQPTTVRVKKVWGVTQVCRLQGPSHHLPGLRPACSMSN